MICVFNCTATGSPGLSWKWDTKPFDVIVAQF